MNQSQPSRSSENPVKTKKGENPNYTGSQSKRSVSGPGFSTEVKQNCLRTPGELPTPSPITPVISGSSMSYPAKITALLKPQQGCESLGCGAQSIRLKTGHPGTFEIQINKQEEGSLWYKYILNILWNVLILKIVMVYMKFKCKWGISLFFKSGELCEGGNVGMAQRDTVWEEQGGEALTRVPSLELP